MAATRTQVRRARVSTVAAPGRAEASTAPKSAPIAVAMRPRAAASAARSGPAALLSFATVTARRTAVTTRAGIDTSAILSPGELAIAIVTEARPAESGISTRPARRADAGHGLPTPRTNLILGVAGARTSAPLVTSAVNAGTARAPAPAPKEAATTPDHAGTPAVDDARATAAAGTATKPRAPVRRRRAASLAVPQTRSTTTVSARVSVTELVEMAPTTTEPTTRARPMPERIRPAAPIPLRSGRWRCCRPGFDTVFLHVSSARKGYVQRRSHW